MSTPPDTGWGGTEAMGPLDAIMWRSEVDPALRSTMVGVELLDRAPDWDRLVAAHEWATSLVPRFRQRVVDPAVTLALPRWVVDDEFDLHYHVRRTRLPEPSTWTTLLAFVEQVAMTPFDRTRSPWEAILVEGLDGGRAAYILKMHHATSDGLGVMQLLSRVHSRTRDHDPHKQVGPPVDPEVPDLRQIYLRQAQEDLRSLPGVATSALGGVARAATSPVGTAKGAISYARSLRRVTGPSAVAGSPLLANRSRSWRFGVLDAPFQPLRAAAKAAGGSFSDGYLAALLGGFRHYHEQLGCPVDAVPVGIPISVRSASDPEGTNKLASGRISGPVGIVDPAERIQAVHRLILAVRDEPAMASTTAVAGLLARLPGEVTARLAGGLTKSNDLQASSIRGIEDEVFLAGAKIERAYPFGPLPGCAVMAAVITHGPTCCVAANFDAAAITEPGLFMECLGLGFGEVLGLDPGSPEVVVRT